jgi:hypothetical protein
MDFQIFRKRLQGSKPIELWSSLYHWKTFGTYMSKMGSHDPFGHFKHKLWPKEMLRIAPIALFVYKWRAITLNLYPRTN